jgi:hypothetical protein
VAEIAHPFEIAKQIFEKLESLDATDHN